VTRAQRASAGETGAGRITTGRSANAGVGQPGAPNSGSSRQPSLRLVLDSGRESLISSSGGLLLQHAVLVSGLDRELSTRISGWRGRRARHDPGKVLIDLATAVALGGDCAADLAVVRAGHDTVYSSPTECLPARLT